METRSGREREREKVKLLDALLFLSRIFEKSSKNTPRFLCLGYQSCFSPFVFFLLSSRCSKAFIPERQRRKHDALTKEKEKEKEKEREEERGEKKKKKKKRRV